MRFSCLTSKFVWGDVNVFQWNREWFFSWRAKFDSGFNVMAGTRSFLAWTKKHEETLLILLRDVLSPRIGCSRIKVDVLSSWSPPESLFRPTAAVFQSRFMRPSFPTLQCLQPMCHPSKFSPRTKRIQGTIQLRFSFHNDGFLTGFSHM